MSETETPFFFDGGSEKLFAVLHHPRHQPARCPFVFCHPFGEEKLWAHRVFVSFARELAGLGHPVLRFDYRGSGDSDGAFTRSSVASAISDIEAAIALVKERTGSSRVGLLGLRLGASLAFKVAAARRDVDDLVLWAPLVDGGRYLQELLRINLTTQIAVYREVREDREALGRVLAAGGTVNVDGYELSKGMADQIGTLALLDERAVPSGRSFIAQVERGENVRRARDIDALLARLPGATAEVVQEDPFWKEILRFYDKAPNLFAATLQWLENR